MDEQQEAELKKLHDDYLSPKAIFQEMSEIVQPGDHGPLDARERLIRAILIAAAYVVVELRSQS